MTPLQTCRVQTAPRASLNRHKMFMSCPAAGAAISTAGVHLINLRLSLQGALNKLFVQKTHIPMSCRVLSGVATDNMNDYVHDMSCSCRQRTRLQYSDPTCRVTRKRQTNLYICCRRRRHSIIHPGLSVAHHSLHLRSTAAPIPRRRPGRHGWLHPSRSKPPPRGRGGSAS
jgi:type IV secretory pathway TraG/TraD family ATPase VirD4